MYKIFFVLLFSCFLLVLVNAQEISNVTVQQVDKTIEVSYDMYGSEIGTIQLFYSTDEGKSYNGPLKSVTGADKNSSCGIIHEII